MKRLSSDNADWHVRSHSRNVQQQRVHPEHEETVRADDFRLCTSVDQGQKRERIEFVRIASTRRMLRNAHINFHEPVQGSGTKTCNFLHSHTALVNCNTQRSSSYLHIEQ